MYETSMLNYIFGEEGQLCGEEGAKVWGGGAMVWGGGGKGVGRRGNGMERRGELNIRVHRLAVTGIPRSGLCHELLELYGISSAHIIKAVKSMI